MFWPTLKNTFIIAVTGIIVGFPAPIILALIINQLRNEKWKKFVQTIVYIPYFISVVVLVSMINTKQISRTFANVVESVVSLNLTYKRLMPLQHKSCDTAEDQFDAPCQ